MTPYEVLIVWGAALAIAVYVGTAFRLSRVEGKIDQLLTFVGVTQQVVEGERMDLAGIKQKVTDLTTVAESAETLLGELSTELKAAIASNDPAALQDIADQIDANKAALAAAVAANTVAAPPPA